MKRIHHPSMNGRGQRVLERETDTVTIGEADPMPDPSKISVAIVDDHPVVLRGLEQLIDAEPDMAVVATARDGAEAIRRVIATHPDVVVMDIRMPGLDGIAATEQILAVHPNIRVILLSGELGASVVSALKAGHPDTSQGCSRPRPGRRHRRRPTDGR
jgi:CheY-like chemotaxis protein